MKQNFFRDRTVYYSTFPIQDQAVQGDWNFRLQAAYTIGILDFVFEDTDTDKDKTVVTEVKLMDIEKKKVFYDKLTFIYLQMPNFNKTEEELDTHFDKWLYVIKNLPKLQDRPVKLQERVFEKLFGLAEIEKFDYKERMEYEDSLKVYRDLKNSLDTAKEEGKEEGREEGEKIGIEKGKKEKAAETAKKLLAMGVLTTEQIAQATGLDIEEVGRSEQECPNELTGQKA